MYRHQQSMVQLTTAVSGSRLSGAVISDSLDFQTISDSVPLPLSSPGAFEGMTPVTVSASSAHGEINV